MNKLYEFGGVADVLIKCKTGCQIGGRSYMAGEPYTLIPDVHVSLSYDQTIATSAAKAPVLATQNAKPTGLVIAGVPLTDKIRNLVMQKLDASPCTRTKAIRITADNNGTYDIAAIEDVWVYDLETGNRVDYTIQDGVLHELSPNTDYILFQPEALEMDKYSLELPHFPYFSIEVMIKGNTDRKTSNMFMYFDAASLLAIPNFTTGSSNLLNAPLTFELIYKNQKEPYIAMG